MDYLNTSIILNTQGSQQEGKGRGSKPEEIGRATVNLEEWARVSQTEKQGEEEEVMDKISQLQAQRKQVPITLRKEGWTSDAILYVSKFPLFSTICTCKTPLFTAAFTRFLFAS